MEKVSQRSLMTTLLRLTNMNEPVLSDNFDQSYCIFVGNYNEKVLNYLKELNVVAIRLLKATFKDKLFCIVIPNHYHFRKIESELFNLYKEGEDSDGFWGQLGMGYRGKSWEVIA